MLADTHKEGNIGVQSQPLTSNRLTLGHLLIGKI